MKIKYSIIILFFITTISCNINKKKQDLKSIKFCNQEIDINEKVISCVKENNVDLTPLIRLKKIELLDLTGSIIKDFTSLRKLVTLKYLLLINTNFKNTDILERLYNLREIYLNNTKIENINFVQKLKKLRVLYIDNTSVHSILPLKRYKNDCNAIFSFKDTNIDTIDIIHMFLKYKESFLDCSPKVKIMEYHSKVLLEGVRVDNPIVISPKCKNKIKLPLDKYKNFKLELCNYEDNNIKEIDLYSFIPFCSLNTSTLSLKYLSFLKNLKNLEDLKIHLKSDKEFFIIENLKGLKKLYLSGNVKKISKLPKTLKELYLYNTKIDDFEFLNNSNLKYLKIVTKNSKNNKWKLLIKKYSNIKIEVFESIFFSPMEYDFMENKRIVYEPEVKFTEDELIKRNAIINKKRQKFICLNHLIDKQRFNGALLEVTYQEYKSIKELRDLIIEKDFLYLILINNYKLINYLIKHYNFNLNDISKNNRTILDEVSGEVDKEIISLLRIHGAKRSCEILKTKCEPLSPEIEKILKNDKK